MSIDLSSYQSLIEQITVQTQPPGPVSQCNWVPSAVAAHIGNRGINYSGSCSGVGTEAGNAQTLALGASALSAVPVVGAGLASVVDAIFGSVIQHHAIAVANEDRAVCQVVQIANQIIPALDTAVWNGQATPSQALTALRQAVSQMKAILTPVSGAGSGGNPCNAGCCYQALLDAHVLFAQQYWQDIYPGAPQPVAPAQPSPTATVSIPQIQSGVSYAGITGTLPLLYDSMGRIVGQPSTLQAQPPAVQQVFGPQGSSILAPVVSVSPTMLLLAVVAIFGIILLMRG